MRMSSAPVRPSRLAALALFSLLTSILACGSDPPPRPDPQPKETATGDDPTRFAARSLMGVMGTDSNSPNTVRAQGLPPLVRHSQTGLYYPSGWRAKSSDNKGVSMLSFAEPRGGSSLGIMAVPRDKATPQKLAEIFVSQFQNVQVLQERPVKGGLFAEVQGSYKNRPMKFSLLTSQGSKTSMVAFFLSPSTRYGTLGGSRLLLAMFGSTGDGGSPQPQPRPQPQPQPQPNRQTSADDRYKIGTFDLRDGSSQVWLLNNPARGATSTTIMGKWGVGESQRLPDGSNSTGFFYDFKPGNKYSMGYTYTLTDQRGCKSTIINGESGAYSFNGSKLVLSPSSGTMIIKPCNQQTKSKKTTGGSSRVYEVAFHPSNKGMVIRGTCPAFAVLSCMGPRGQQYLRQGLARR